MKGTRDLRVDNVRGVLIFLVVAGHFLLPVNGERLTMNLMYLIYSFHMPCFMLVSGYLSHGIYTRERGFRWDRWVQLLWLFILFKRMVNVTEGMLADSGAGGPFSGLRRFRLPAVFKRLSGYGPVFRISGPPDRSGGGAASGAGSGVPDL